ncbi:MAG: hypothetical protein US97_C0056G0013 [Microgenomates group bacterium GW2011_GWF1_38_5]|nr:MAG: hypothetical protein US97_C0056G0013 [Microgenomates group bacterium GW2011_GWF1_38_5]
MGIYAESSPARKLIPAGSYVARCYQMIELGTQEMEFKGVKKLLKKANLTWELPTEMEVFNEEKGEQPFSISNDYTLSMFEGANLRRDLEGWRGKGFSEEEATHFDITKLVGVACLLNVIHKPAKNGKTYANIASISTLPKGIICPAQINPSRILQFEDFDYNLYKELPEFLQEKISASPEFKALMKIESETTTETIINQVADGGDLPF